MDLWFRVETLVRSWLNTGDSEQISADAWRELEDFLREEPLESPRSPHAGSSDSSGNSRDRLPAPIRQALLDLELSPGATLEEIKRAYRKQLIQYHPDRHSGDEVRYTTAAEVTRRLTLAYQRLCDYYS
ncbi:MAG: DnaJ domain-containing protein [Alkalispirochaeta sp.]